MRAILVLVAMMLVGCASIEGNPNALNDAYSRYGKALADNAVVEKRNELFAPSMLSKLDFNSEKDAAELTFGSYLYKERSHYEKADGEHGCLTINGAQEDGEPAAMFLEYQRIGGTWLISNVYVYLQDKPKSFDRALCPEEARREVMR
jgi:hypothetical protein